MTEIEPNRPEHVVLYAMLRWFNRHKDRYTPIDPDIVVVRKMAEIEGPLQPYGRDGVYSYVQSLKEKGLVQRVDWHGQTLGYALTEEGADLIEEMGKPKQYDH